MISHLPQRLFWNFLVFFSFPLHSVSLAGELLWPLAMTPASVSQLLVPIGPQLVLVLLIQGSLRWLPTPCAGPLCTRFSISTHCEPHKCSEPLLAAGDLNVSVQMRRSQLNWSLNVYFSPSLRQILFFLEFQINTLPSQIWMVK